MLRNPNQTKTIFMNSKINGLILLMNVLLLFGCESADESFGEIKLSFEGIQGTQEYDTSSYITSGDRLYAIGAQNGTFPEIGWHIKDEMGGVWDHPIKLLDGYQVSLITADQEVELNNAKFTNYPFVNSFEYELSSLQLKVNQLQFVPDQKEGMIVEYELINTADKAITTDFKFSFSVDLRPTWLGEQSQMIDGKDLLTFDDQQQVFISKDELNEWYVVVGMSKGLEASNQTKSNYKGNGIRGDLITRVALKPKEIQTIKVFIAGSYMSKQKALSSLDEIREHSKALLVEKTNRFNLINENSKLTTSDKEFDQRFRWIKYNSDWFVREVPEIGRGIAAGYPDYPWWFGCDSEYALQGYLAIGNHQLTKSTIELLASLSNKTNSNGRIIHETSTNGVVFNPGNINETPQFWSLLWKTYQWTGDEQILLNYFDLVKKGSQWLLTERDEDQNGFPEGAGMMEIHGLESEMIDVVSYTQSGLEDASKIAQVLGEDELAREFLNKASQLKEQINSEFWVEDFNSYGDFIANDQQTLHLIEDAIVRADTLNKPWAVQELQQTKSYVLQNPSKSNRPFVLHHNWVVNTPLEMKIADKVKADKALETARKFVNPFGVFVTGIDRDESAGKDSGSFKGSEIFSYTGAVMTLPTGVSAVAENNYGNPDRALDYLTRMGRSFSYALPGSFYEVSPDYGMFAQAWNIYSYAVPVVQQFFGIQPNAASKRIEIQPLMPSSWEYANLENVKVGSNTISVFYNKLEKGYELKIHSKDPNWIIEVLPREDFELIETIEINNQTKAYKYQNNN